MLTLVIYVGLYVIECMGVNCYSISRGSFEAMVALGFVELIYEIKNVVQIYRKKEEDK